MRLFVVGFWMVIIAAVFAAAVSIPTWLLWNWLMPSVFGLPTVSLAQAFGLLLLSGFIFGSRHIQIAAT